MFIQNVFDAIHHHRRSQIPAMKSSSDVVVDIHVESGWPLKFISLQMIKHLIFNARFFCGLIDCYNKTSCIAIQARGNSIWAQIHRICLSIRWFSAICVKWYG